MILRPLALREAAFEDGTDWEFTADFVFDLEGSQRGPVAVLLAPEAEFRRGNGVAGGSEIVDEKGEFLLRDRDLDSGSGALHLVVNTLVWRPKFGNENNIMSKSYHVAIAGATGAVGAEMLLCLEQRGFPIGTLTPLASARSAGKTLKFKGEDVVVKEITPDSFEGVDFALFSAGGGISVEFAKHAVAAGAVVIDNSSAFRMDETVSLGCTGGEP